MTAPALTQYINGVGSLTGDGLNTMVQSCDTFAQLRAFPGTTGLQVYARGGASLSDGLQGNFYWSSGATGTDDGVNTISPYGYANSPGRWLRSPVTRFGQVDLWVEDFRATGDAWQFTDGTVNGNQISFTDTAWELSAVRIGNPIALTVGGQNLTTTIAGVLSANTLLLATSAPASGSAFGEFGTNDTTAIQAAINAVSALGGGIVNFSGASSKYLVAGPMFTNGTWTDYSGDVTPFQRGMIALSSNVKLIGRGATILLSGGRTNPGGLFTNLWWESLDPLLNLRISGLVLDCNMANQVTPVYPANTTDGYIWQQGNPITAVYVINFELDHCVLQNAYGNGVLMFGQDSGALANRNVRIHDNEFNNLFTSGIGGSSIGLWLYDNYFHGNGYWVASIDLEISVYTEFNLDLWITNNEFDFRDGLSPTENTPQYASNSPEAIAAQVHLRRFLSLGFFGAGFPGNAYNGATGRVTISGNKVWQGTMDAYNYPFVHVTENIITNTYEDISGHELIEANAIHFGYSGSDVVTGLTGIFINDNYIDSALDGYAVYMVDFTTAHTTGNMIVNCGLGGIRYDVSAGEISDNDIENVGSTGSGFAVTMGESGGGITATIASGGSNYPIAPIITLSGGGGTGGAAIAVLTDGVVTSLTVTPGTGYTSAPTAVISRDPLADSYSSGIILFGTGTNTLDVQQNRCRDTRTGSARQMTYAVFANVGALPLARIQDNTGANMIDGIVNDLNNSTLLIGNGDGVNPSWVTNAPLDLTAGLTSNTLSVVTSGSTDSIISIQSGSSANRIVSFTDGSGVEYQLIQIDTNAFAMQRFLDGVFQWTDLSFGTSGRLTLNIGSYGDYANDAAAAAAGVVVGGVYRNGSVLQIRVS